MDSLFPDTSDMEANESEPAVSPSQAPLAARMRPKNISEVVGQQHIIGEGHLLRRAIEADRFSSLIFYGPPGTGKTTLATVIANNTDCRFEMLNGVESNVAEVRDKISQAQKWRQLRDQTTILFIDEIHRFNKAQQDVLLPHVERGTVRFIGATTHNPYFYVNSPLVSRSQIFQLEPITSNDLVDLMQVALSDKERGLGSMQIIADAQALAHIAEKSDGDARRALTALELAALTTPEDDEHHMIRITLEVAEESIQHKAIVYDADGDQHYDTASAFIKSIRGSDPNAAVYWLSRMIEGGEDVKFIARRLLILASEDIGNANPTALVIANNCFQAVNVIGFPEARITLSQAVIYLACSAKSNASYMAINEAQDEVRKSGNLSVPLHLRNAPSKLMKELGYGKDYIYSHNKPSDKQEFLPEEISGKTLYNPSNNSKENAFKEGLKNLWKGKYNY